MTLQPFDPGRDVHDLAAIAGVDWRDIATRNGIDPLSTLPINPALTALDIPLPSEVRGTATRALGTVSNTIRTASGRVTGLVSKVSNAANQIADILPDSMKGYVAPALAAIGQVNGVLGSVTSRIDDVLGDVTGVLGGGTNDNRRTYGGSAVRLIDWLFER